MYDLLFYNYDSALMNFTKRKIKFPSISIYLYKFPGYVL